MLLWITNTAGCRLDALEKIEGRDPLGIGCARDSKTISFIARYRSLQDLSLPLFQDYYYSKMPGVSARSANKNVSKAKRAAFTKNNARVEGALSEDLEGYCTFGKISKNFGYGRFLVLNSDKREHICTIRGSIAKAIRPSVDDVVLLSIRDYETRAKGANGVNAVYDIIASLDKKAVAKLIKSKTVPRWMNGKIDDADNTLEHDDIFDYDDDEDEDSSSENETESNIVSKKDKKNHRASLAGAATNARDNDDIDIDAI